MNKAFDIGVEALGGRSRASGDFCGVADALHDSLAKSPLVVATSEAPRNDSDAVNGGEGGGTFYLETFGCQMNDHDSEKVAGLLLSRGYRQVESPEAARMILYNTCSIREKAAQKVFSRLGEYRLPNTSTCPTPNDEPPLCRRPHPLSAASASVACS